MHRPRGPKSTQEREPVRQGDPEATPTALDPSLVEVQERRRGGAGEAAGGRGGECETAGPKTGLFPTVTDTVDNNAALTVSRAGIALAEAAGH